MKQRPVTVIKQGDRFVVRVPLGPANGRIQGFAELDMDSWEKILSKGCTGNLGTIDGRGRPYVIASVYRAKAPVLISRVIMEAKENQIVRHKDGDTTNLRRENLRLVNVSAKYRDHSVTNGDSIVQ